MQRGKKRKNKKKNAGIQIRRRDLGSLDGCRRVG